MQKNQLPLSLFCTREARDGKQGRERRLGGGAPTAGGRLRWPFRSKGDEEQREKVRGSVQSGGRVGKAALLRLPARPSIPRAPQHPCPAPGGVVSGVPLAPDLPATFPRGWIRGLGAGKGCSASPRPTPRTFARGAGHDYLPPRRGPQGPDPQVASRGLCGVTGGGSPSRGRLPARSLLPLALGRSASAGRRLSAALGLPRGPQAPPHALRASGLAPNPPSARLPRLSCPVLSPSHLCRGPCPLGATPPVGAPSLCPWWWGKKGAWDAGAAGRGSR